MKFSTLLFTLLVAGSLLGHGAEASGTQTNGQPESAKNEPAKDTNAPPAFKIKTTSLNPPGINYGVPGTDVLLKLNDQKPALGFYVPSGWHVRSANANNSLFLISREPLLGSITVSVELDPDRTATPFNADTLRPLILENFKGAQITEESSAGALGAEGFAFNLAQSVGGETWVIHTIVVPSVLGQVHITLRSPRDKVGEIQSTLARVIASLRLVSKEEQEHPPAPSKSLTS